MPSHTGSGFQSTSADMDRAGTVLLSMAPTSLTHGYILSYCSHNTSQRFSTVQWEVVKCVTSCFLLFLTCPLVASTDLVSAQLTPITHQPR